MLGYQTAIAPRSSDQKVHQGEITIQAYLDHVAVENLRRPPQGQLPNWLAMHVPENYDILPNELVFTRGQQLYTDRQAYVISSLNGATGDLKDIADSINLMGVAVGTMRANDPAPEQGLTVAVGGTRTIRVDDNVQPGDIVEARIPDTSSARSSTAGHGAPATKARLEAKSMKDNVIGDDVLMQNLLEYLKPIVAPATRPTDENARDLARALGVAGILGYLYITGKVGVGGIFAPVGGTAAGSDTHGAQIAAHLNLAPDVEDPLVGAALGAARVTNIEDYLQYVTGATAYAVRQGVLQLAAVPAAHVYGAAAAAPAPALVPLQNLQGEPLAARALYRWIRKRFRNVIGRVTRGAPKGGEADVVLGVGRLA